jgi:UDP-glucose 4-epimerase
MVVPRFVQSALRNEAVQIYGTGQQRRCFCYVEDLIDGIVGLMNCAEAAGKAYNVGSREEITIEGLADTIIEMTDSKSRKEFVPYEIAYGRCIEDMMWRVPSLERIKERTGWEPKTSLADALGIIIRSFKGD